MTRKPTMDGGRSGVVWSLAGPAGGAVLAMGILLLSQGIRPVPAAEGDEAVARMLAEMLRAARTVVGDNQALINDPDIGDKGLDGEAVLADALGRFERATGALPDDLPPGSREARLVEAMADSVREVLDEHQDVINAEDVGFKGFIPALVGRLVSERFGEKVGDEARIRVTAPEPLVRNRRSRPDAFEREVIESRLGRADWPQGQAYTEITEAGGQTAFRMLVPEYYTEGCLACHGGPAGEIDITGYPKEGGSLGDLGGVISITLFH